MTSVFQILMLLLDILWFFTQLLLVQELVYEEHKKERHQSYRQRINEKCVEAKTSGVCRADPEIDDGQTAAVRRRLHGFVLSVNSTVELGGEVGEVILEVRKQDVITELVQRHPGVSGKPVSRNIMLFEHLSSPACLWVVYDDLHSCRTR